uniref:DNA helicase n=1 Tax=Vitis vinifera TaxID=29760 RepID=A5BE78_VITVI|nr:hypothetical protein VITISV_017570 [Vitis vinifera]
MGASKNRRFIAISGRFFRRLIIGADYRFGAARYLIFLRNIGDIFRFFNPWCPMGRAGSAQPDIDRAITGQRAGLARLTYKVCWARPTHAQHGSLLLGRAGLAATMSGRATGQNGRPDPMDTSTKNPEWDAVVSSHILSVPKESEKDRRDENLANIWPLPLLRSNAERTTVRMLESLIRLAQAHAGLMFRNEVTRLDAITAILCIESSMTTSTIVDNVENALHSNFTENPDQECYLSGRYDKDRSTPSKSLKWVSTNKMKQSWYLIRKSMNTRIDYAHMGIKMCIVNDQNE